MTYFGFLFRFLFIPIFVFLAITIWDNKNNRQARGFRNGHAAWVGIAIHLLLAVAYTTPWDNYLVATGVWYYNPNLVTGWVIGYVPIEEYTFFVVETILSGLWWWLLARRLSPPKELFTPNRRFIYLSTCILFIIWLIVTVLFFSNNAPLTYLSITLFWALPPIIIQLIFGADILWQYRKLVFWAIMVPGIYLSFMDIVALKETTWSISPAQTTGILFFGILPLEEVVFFFITNVLIVFGMTLLLANVSQERFAEIKNRVKSLREKRRFNLQARSQDRGSIYARDIVEKQ